jgi:foldase protein PrsA
MRGVRISPVWAAVLLVAVGLLGAAARGPRAALALDGDAVAVVDGQTITRAELERVLMEGYGFPILKQLILRELARAETRRRGIRVAQADVDAEFERSLDEIAARAGMTGEQATRENRMRALLVMLEQKHISMAEYRVAMERNAHLRAIYLADFKVDEPTLREEFARTYGEKVLVRHIQINDPRDAKRLNEVVGELNRGADFTKLAERYSDNRETAARGGELRPFTFDDEDIPPALREAAFALAPGGVSAPIRTNQYIHILKLERRIPPENVRFEDVRRDVELKMRQRLEVPQMNEIAERLFQQSKVRVIDTPLREKYEAFLRDVAAQPRSRP